MSVRVAVVGSGRFGREHIRAYREIGADIVGVADPEPQRAEAGGLLASAPAYTSVAELLRTARPDAVSVVVPAAARGELVTELADDGIAVLVEKPLAASASEARALADRYAGAPVMAGHLLRFARPYRDARDGTPRVTRITTDRRRDAGHRTDYPSEDVVGLTLVHDLDAIQWIAGPRAWRVRAQGESVDGRWVAVRAELVAPGLTAIATAEWVGSAADASDFLELEGSEGTHTVRIDAQQAGGVYDAALRDELAHFLDCARRGSSSPILDLAGSATTVALADAVSTSLREGRSVDVRAE